MEHVPEHGSPYYMRPEPLSYDFIRAGRANMAALRADIGPPGGDLCGINEETLQPTQRP